MSHFLGTDETAFPSRPLADSDSVQMLTRSTQVGEFYVMGPPAVAVKKFVPGFLNMLIYDEEADKHVVVSWEEAIAATAAGTLGFTNTHNKELKGGEKIKEWWGKALVLSYINKGFVLKGDDAASVTTDSEIDPVKARDPNLYDPIQNTTDGMKKLNNMLKLFECYCVVARPFIEHLMHSAVLTVSGRDTGATLFGPADM